MGGNFKRTELGGETEEIKSCNIEGKKKTVILIILYLHISKTMKLDKEEFAILNEKETK